MAALRFTRIMADGSRYPRTDRSDIVGPWGTGMSAYQQILVRRRRPERKRDAKNPVVITLRHHDRERTPEEGVVPGESPPRDRGYCGP